MQIIVNKNAIVQIGLLTIGLLTAIGLVQFPVAVATGLVMVIAGLWIFYRNQIIISSELAICAFWLLYALQSTVLNDIEQFKFHGLFYPLYLLMVVAAGKNFFKVSKTGELRWFLLLYYLFLSDVVLSLLANQALLFDFTTLQLIFIYSLGLLTMFQFSSLRARNFFRLATAISSVIVSLWVIFSYLTSSHIVIYRGDISVNPNYVSTIIAIGAIVTASSFTKKTHLGRKSVAFLSLVLELYAMTLLASRGIAIALLAGLAVLCLGKISRFRKLVWASLFAAILVAVLIQLPGVEMLLQRFSYNDIQTLNERTFIWQGCLDLFRNGTLFQFLFGFGFRASEAIVASVMSGYTSTHNGYLRILLEQGVFGLMLFLSMHVLVLRHLWHNCRFTRQAHALFAFLLVSNLSGSISDSFLYWIAFGAVSSAAFGITKEEEGIITWRTDD